MYSKVPLRERPEAHVLGYELWNVLLTTVWEGLFAYLKVIYVLKYFVLAEGYMGMECPAHS